MLIYQFLLHINCVSGDSKTVFESSRTKRAPEQAETVRPFLNGGSHNYCVQLHNLFNPSSKSIVCSQPNFVNLSLEIK